MTQAASEPLRALVLHPVTPSSGGRDPEFRLEEASGLAEALDLAIVDARSIIVRAVKPDALFGRGKVGELKAVIEELAVDIVIVDAAVTPVQQRNLERAWNAKVLDRTGLILEIFGERARTREGRLQVELAQLAYDRSRLVRTWTHLERQRGGRGFLAGPGETQIEADRRVIADRIAKLRRELNDVRRTRGLHRAQRNKTPFPLVALVGYTNAGKSTIFNALTGARVIARDMLFATLDPTLRGVRLPSGVNAMFADTVGFISDLPPELVASFQATLEEVVEADLLVHVRDISHPQTDEQSSDVEDVLENLEAGREHGQHIIEVWNKSDLLPVEDGEVMHILAQRRRRETPIPAVLTSARTGEGLDALLDAVDAAITEGAALHRASLGPAEGRAKAWLYEHGDVLEEVSDDTGAITMSVRLSALAAGRFARSFPGVALTLEEDE